MKYNRSKYPKALRRRRQCRKIPDIPLETCKQCRLYSDDGPTWHCMNMTHKQVVRNLGRKCCFSSQFKRLNKSMDMVAQQFAQLIAKEYYKVYLGVDDEQA